MAVAPFEAYELDTLVRDASGAIVSPKNRPELNTTGESVFVMRTGTVVKQPLSIAQSYDLDPGSYALTVSFDVYHDSDPGWYTHLMSLPMQLTVTR